MLLSKPTFRESTHLARYIRREYRKASGNRPKTGAFQKVPNETSLSVNSTEVETLNQIARTFAIKFEDGRRPVAISTPKISDYNKAATSRGVSVQIIFDDTAKVWKFQEFGQSALAYKHDKRTDNKSHCGIEYIRIFDDRADFNSAVRMAKAATYKMT